MSRMETLEGIDIEFDAPGDRDTSLLEKQIGELKELGLAVTRIRVPEDATPRYYVTFPPLPMYQVRTWLEAKNWDVGQEMGEKMLQFYVTKRSQPSRGWEGF